MCENKLLDDQMDHFVRASWAEWGLNETLGSQGAAVLTSRGAVEHRALHNQSASRFILIYVSYFTNNLMILLNNLLRHEEHRMWQQAVKWVVILTGADFNKLMQYVPDDLTSTDKKLKAL